MARMFNGTSDQIAFGSEAALDNVSTFTAMALVRITGNVVDERQILDKMTSGYGGKMYLAAFGDGTDNNRIGCIVTGGTGMSAFSDNNALIANTWRVVVATWAGWPNDPNGRAPKLYACTVGGVLAELSYAATVAGDVTPPDSDASATLRIASRDPADATFFAGGLAECALWNRVLSDGELAALGRGFAPAFFPNGRVFYSTVDGRSSPELNYAGTTHGTLTGTSYLEHPPIIYPSRSIIGRHIASAGGSFQAAWARNANTVVGVGAR